MFRLTDYPLPAFAISLISLWVAAWLGARFAHRLDKVREDFSIILTATLTLLGLIVGFTFSMSVGRYDQRKVYEEAEANSIGTEYLRTQLLPASSGENIRGLLRDYLDQRILFYAIRDTGKLREIDVSTAQLQAKLWESVKDAAVANPSPLTSLATSGMNDVLNSQSSAQAALWNRIPRAAWILLDVIAIGANIMVGLSLRRAGSSKLMIAVLPTIVSVALLLIADIDSPRSGLIHVEPENLKALAGSLQP